MSQAHPTKWELELAGLISEAAGILAGLNMTDDAYDAAQAWLAKWRTLVTQTMAAVDPTPHPRHGD